MAERQAMDDSRRDTANREERVLVDRLVLRQGLSRAEATRLVDSLREGRRGEIDPALMLMEGRDTL
jgi:hypothetical protein